MHIDYLQIGSHTGKNNPNDFLYGKELENKSLILFEPIPELFEELKKTYETAMSTNNIHFLNIAVSNVDGMLDLYIPSKIIDMNLNPGLKEYVSQLSSVRHDHIHSHNAIIPIDKISVPCYRLNTIVRIRNITSIDNLLVDTEGHDYEILMDLDLTIIKPKFILFENKHVDGYCQKNIKYKEMIDHFVNNGYIIVLETPEDTHMKLL